MPKLPIKIKKKWLLIFFLSFSLGCAAPKSVPKDLSRLKSPGELGLASKQAYEKARDLPGKQEKLEFSHAGILYSDKCLKMEPKKPICLFYNVLNRGIYIKNHIPYYQKSLRIMVANCETLNEVEPAYENAGCFRILGDIYAKAPSFSANPDNISRDTERSAQYLRQAVQLAPDYALNHLLLARSLAELGETAEAREQLKEFDRLNPSNLDNIYPEWKKEREDLARKLQKN